MAFQPPRTILTLLGFGATGDLGPFTFYTNKRGRLVWFIKAPPTSPPSYAQLRQQDLFTSAAATWQFFTPTRRNNWELASKRASLAITGYNLWVYFCCTADLTEIQTIEHQTGLNLLA